MDDIMALYLSLWFLTVPITIYVVYTIAIEFLDVVCNTRRINRLLKRSDLFDVISLENDHVKNQNRQKIISKSNLIELDRQLQYIRLAKNLNSFANRKIDLEIGKIVSAKEISDVFKAQ